MGPAERTGWLARLRERGVLRVAASYAVIAWLALQIADVTLEPLGAPRWLMTALIIAAAAPTTDLDAYDLYLAAKTQLAIRTDVSIRKSIDLSEQAVRLDPQFARGQAQLAHSLLFQAMRTQGGPDTASSAAFLRRAESAVHKALSLDPDLSEAHGAYANLLRNSERPGAEEQYRRALELNPNNAVTWHDYAVYLANHAGRPEEAKRARDRALEIDPRQPVTWANYLADIAADGRARYEAEYARAVRTVGDMPGALDRFGFVTWSRDRHGYREALLAAQRLAEEHAASAVFTMFPGAYVPGFPLPLMRAARSIMAFWFAVQGRDQEASESLAMAEPVPVDRMPPTLGADRH